MNTDDAGVAGPGSSPSVEPQAGLDASHSIPIANSAHLLDLADAMTEAIIRHRSIRSLYPIGKDGRHRYGPRALLADLDLDKAARAYCAAVGREFPDRPASRFATEEEAIMASWASAGVKVMTEDEVTAEIARGIDASGQDAQRLDAEHESPTASPLGDAPKSSLEIKAQEGRA